MSDVDILEGEDSENFRSPNWNFAQTIQLINLFIDPDWRAKFNRGQRSHKATYELLAKKLSLREGTTGDQAKFKMDDLKRKWTAQEKKLGSGAKAPTFEFYYELQEFMKSRKTVNLKDAKDTERDEDFIIVENVTSPPDTPSPASQKKRRMTKRKREEEEENFKKFLMDTQKRDTEIAQQSVNLLGRIADILEKNFLQPPTHTNPPFSNPPLYLHSPHFTHSPFIPPPQPSSLSRQFSVDNLIRPSSTSTSTRNMEHENGY